MDLAFADMLKAGEMAVAHGAAMVYHEVAAITTDVREWEADNPKVAALLDEGVSLAERWLIDHSIPVNQVVVLVKDVVGVLKRAAITDADVPVPPKPQGIYA